MTRTCSLGAPVDVLTSYGTVADLEIDLAAGASSAMVAARVRFVANYPQQGIVSTPLTGTGAPGTSTTLSEYPNGLVRMPAVAARGTGWVVAWSDTRGMTNLDILSRFLDAGGTPTATPARMTVSSNGEDSLALLATANGTLFTWFERMNVGADIVRLALMDASDGFSATPADVTSSTGIVTRPVLGSIDGNAFAAYRGAGPMRVSALAADGSSGGPVHDVSMSAMVADAWDFAGANGPTTGAIVFEHSDTGLRTVVRFRPIGTDGTGQFQEPELSGAVDQGFRPSLAPFAGGYLVAYRHKASGGGMVLRVLLVDALGNVLDTDDSSALAASDGDVRIRVAANGQPYLVFEDTTMVTIPGNANPMAGAVLRSVPVTCTP